MSFLFKAALPPLFGFSPSGRAQRDFSFCYFFSLRVIFVNVTEQWLEENFPERSPREFYRDVFPAGELDAAGAFEKGKYTAIALCISKTEEKQKVKTKKQADGSVLQIPVVESDGSPKMEPKVYRYTMTDDLDLIDELTSRDDLFCLMSPISYAGKNRSAENARFLYGITIDVDGLLVGENGTPSGIRNCWSQIRRAGRIPRPTYIISSGTGLHFYYLLTRPVALFPSAVKPLQKLRHFLTFLLWHDAIVDEKHCDEVQYEGVFQGFRMPGTITKNNGRVRAFLTGEKVTIDYLNKFVEPKSQATDLSYKRDLSLEEAKKKYPEWYEERVVECKKGVLHPWAVNRRVYDWWKRQIYEKTRVGHRYYCMMILVIYAYKCGFYDENKNPNPVTREELERDAYDLMRYFETMTDSDDNHFTESDVLDALDAYDHGMLTFPRQSIAYKAGFLVEPTVPRRPKGKQLKQNDHLEAARAIRDIRQKIKGTKWTDGNGRPSAEAAVAEWQQQHPEGKKIECHRETGLSRMTIDKWWRKECRSMSREHTTEIICRGCTIGKRKGLWDFFKSSNYIFQSNTYMIFEPEPTNVHDPNAVKIVFKGEIFGTAGYVGKEFTAEVKEIIKQASNYTIDLVDERQIGYREVALRVRWLERE